MSDPSSTVPAYTPGPAVAEDCTGTLPYLVKHLEHGMILAFVAREGDAVLYANALQLVAALEGVMAAFVDADRPESYTYGKAAALALDACVDALDAVRGGGA